MSQFLIQIWIKDIRIQIQSCEFSAHRYYDVCVLKTHGSEFELEFAFNLNLNSKLWQDHTVQLALISVWISSKIRTSDKAMSKIWLNTIAYNGIQQERHLSVDTDSSPWNQPKSFLLAGSTYTAPLPLDDHLESGLSRSHHACSHFNNTTCDSLFMQKSFKRLFFVQSTS